MLTQREFITMSIDLNLFFLRIMKEHSFFLQVAFTPKDSALAAEAADFVAGFEKLLSEATDLADGVVSRDTLNSRQIVTQYTAEAERLTNFYTGVPFNLELTRREAGLSPGAVVRDSATVNAVEMLDRRAYRLTSSLAEFKERILSNVRACKMFTLNYPLLIEHILREARLFMNMLAALVRGEDIMRPEGLIEQEVFWNRIMAEHSKFIAGLLDPTEEALIDTARAFGKEFDRLTNEATMATRQSMSVSGVTNESLRATMRLRDFKEAGTKGLLDCSIESIIIPLLGDHVLREANHYLCILGVCSAGR
ncbi:MAG: hypothetical protein BWY11_02167 [Firmicutes bacterium ADurb.Bin182]|nr:MAG: hypothetical protein BWY11_02167 [Firmicutes bacterium ADurb.Bin182]